MKMKTREDRAAGTDDAIDPGSAPRRGSGGLVGQHGDAAIELGDRLRQLLTADGVLGHARLALQFGAGQAQRLQLLLAHGILDDAAVADPFLLEFVESILDSRLGVNKSSRAVPHTLLFTRPILTACRGS